MKVSFLGTAAANAYPEAFCLCANCQSARILGGPSLRKRSSLLINDDLLIDLGPDIMSAAQIHRINLTKVAYCLQTHPHADHLDLSHLLSRSPDYGVIGAPLLNFFGSAETFRSASQTFLRDLANFDLLSPAGQQLLNLKIHTISPLIPFNAGNYQVIAFPANHEPNPGSLMYAVREKNQSIFYGVDTASFFEETWSGFHQFNLQFDLVILDHTYGPQQPESDHLNSTQLIQHIQRLQKGNLLKPNAKVFATHIAHEGNPPHAELSAFAALNGYEIAYDGLILSF